MSNKEAYLKFVESKIKLARRSGFEPDRAMFHPMLFPHQVDVLEWALRRGKALIAMSFGLGKTILQNSLAIEIIRKTGGKFMVICPLGVKHQFQSEDGPLMGIDWLYVTSDAEIEAADTPFLITNYERVRDGGIDPSKHNIAGISLDEGSVLRSMDSKTTNTFLEIFKDTPYKFVCTATPSPNNYKEIIYYANFLDVMDTGLALTRFFKRDSQKAGNLTIHPHHERDFWMWVASWAVFIYKPSDLGHLDTGYDLPELKVHWHKVSVDHKRAWGQVDNRGQAKLFLDAATGTSAAAAEKRETIDDRLEKAVEIIGDNPDRHWLLWHDLEREREAIEKVLPDVVTVYGSQDLETKERHILDFTHGKTKIMASKPSISGSGCNFQKYCHSNIFLGVGYFFEDFLQSIHRTYRFQQAHDVDVHIIYAESEEEIVRTLQRKWAQHDKLTSKMQTIVKKYGLNHIALRDDIRRTIGIMRREEKGKYFTAVNNDCVLEMFDVESDSVGMQFTSIPFGNHYEFSASYNDFGHNPTNNEFWQQMDFLIPELYRTLKPGRVAVMHVKDRVAYGHQTRSGFMEIFPFSDECVMAFRRHGFMYEGRRTLVKDVVQENAQTYRLGWTELTNDATKMGCGSPEYLLLFRKPPSDKTNARADEPVTKEKKDYSRARWQIDAHAFWRSNGNRLLEPQEYAVMHPRDAVGMWNMEQLSSGQPYDHERHVAICEAMDDTGRLSASFMMMPPKVTKSEDDAVWDDIVYMRTLNSDQSRGREEAHICPLPIDIVERVIRLYSNPDDLILDPFGGLFTVPVVAVKMGRTSYGIELNDVYYDCGLKYCNDAEQNRMMPTLFDWLEQVQAQEIETTQ